MTVGGPDPTRPLSEFDRNIAGTEFYVGPNATGVGDDERAGRSKESSLLTLVKALTLTTASKNDIIYLLPGHTETVATAGAITWASMIGVRVVGLGVGALRPTFTFSAVDATMTMTAASGSIENVIIKPSIDAVVSPIVVSAADCKVDVEIQDASATVECECGILTTAAADRLDVDLKYRGFIAGNACVNAIKLVGVDTARINVDFYGVASTSIVEFHTTACHDIDITGKFYNDGTSLTQNVVDTVGGSTWSAQGWDGNSNANFAGGDNKAIAADDVSVVASDLATVSMRCVEKAADVLTGADDIFVISGGPVRAKLIGIVTTVIGGASNAKLTMTTTDPAATVDLSNAAVAINTDAKGTSYHSVGAAATFTPTTAGMVKIDPVTVDETYFILPIGTVHFDNSAAQTGEVTWYMTYEALSPDSVVAAAA
ncbi:MAG: hypothetical protein IMF11_09005 [Proteobacteria bacterium]|nr:hypothetical protein [Pseudomonadota bacterium]